MTQAKVILIKHIIVDGPTCVGCKFLYGDGTGYSNWTWMDTYVKCALNKNPNLLKESDDTEEPCDWSARGHESSEVPGAQALNRNDNWQMTNSSACERWSPGDYITLDPDREIVLSDVTKDQEQIDAIREHQPMHIK